MDKNTSAKALTDAHIAMLRGLLISIRPEFGVPGSRDVDVARQQRRIDAALSILVAEQPSEPASSCDPADVCAGCRCKYGACYRAPDQAEQPSEDKRAFDTLASLVDIYDDAQNNAPEHRCYIDGAFKIEMDHARAFVAERDAAIAKGEGK